MSDSTPIVSVIIAARPDQADVKAVEAARRLEHPRDKLEIIVARGKQPSVQRNHAVRQAKGELIYFLDDDSIADPGNLKRAIGHFEKEQVCMLGGPNLCPTDAPRIEKEFATVMANPLAFGPSRARYAPIGERRESSEKELILCNLIARKSAFLDAGGFDEALYPNEENALMDELQKNGGKLLYDPEFIVFRRPRSTMKAFQKMLVNYGRGRAEQFRLHPSSGSLLNFAPAAMILFLVFLAVAFGAAQSWFFFRGQAVPDAFYKLSGLGAFVMCLGYGGPLFVSAYRNRHFPSVPPSEDNSPVAPLVQKQMELIGRCHFAYGFGFLAGLSTKLAKPGTHPEVEVKLEVAQPV